MLTIIGCGNPNRSDDGAGVAVVRELLARYQGTVPAGVRVLDAGTSGVEVMFQARGSRELIVIDASRSGSEPGAVFALPGHVLESGVPEGSRAPEPVLGLHGFRWDHALLVGRRMFGEAFPSSVTVYLIEAETLELGVGLSPCVLAAVERVVDLVWSRLPHVSSLGAPAAEPASAVLQPG